MKWYFINPETKEKVYLSLEEKYAELAWDFRHKKDLNFFRPIEKIDRETLRVLVTLYDLDIEEEAYEIVKWIYYFHYNSNESSNNDYVPVRGE